MITNQMETQMYRKIMFTLFILICATLFTACSPQEVSPTPEANMPNPASVYCEQNGGTLEIRTDASGGQAGACIFPDGSECDEWAYYRGECKPGNTPVAPEPTLPPTETEQASTEPSPTTEPEADEEFASDGWRIYRNETLGYSFHYPADAQIVDDDNPLKSITVQGPLVNGEYWPLFTISHPSDREEYRLPVDVNLEQWLMDHNLLGDMRQPDVQIAGTTAIHLRHDRSPQSYAYDRYFFAHSGQLYMIVIGHSGDKEDWELYNHFLGSFQFDQ
jgi:putative hemolysin